MVLGHDIEGCLNIGDKHMSVFDIDPEFSLQGLVDVHAGLDVDVPSFISPVGVERHGHSLNYGHGTFQRSGSIWFSLLCTHLIMRFAVRPGWVG